MMSFIEQKFSTWYNQIKIFLPMVCVLGVLFKKSFPNSVSQSYLFYVLLTLSFSFKFIGIEYIQSVFLHVTS